MFIGLALSTVIAMQRLDIETVRNMSFQKSDHRVHLRRLRNTTPLFYQSKMSCDVDGSPNAYHPVDDRLSLDVIESAGGKRKDDQPDGALMVQPSAEVVVWTQGKPYIQPAGEFKGFYVSRTSMQNIALPEVDPNRYLDARRTQYIVLPSDMVPEARIGDVAAVYDPATRKVAYAVFGDIGPTTESGEAALSTLQRLGMATSDGKFSPAQARDDLFYVVFPGTASLLLNSDFWSHRQDAIDTVASAQLSLWGGVEQIESILKQAPEGGSIPDTEGNVEMYDEFATLKSEGLVRAFAFSLPQRLQSEPEGRLPCAPEVVWAAKDCVTAISQRIEAVELSKVPVSSLKGMSNHLRRLRQVFHHFPAATLDVGEGVLRETARCDALIERIVRCSGSVASN